MDNQMEQSSTSPTWWKEDHTSAWDKVKAAFRRDWEQTKADLTTKHGKELDQNAGDTVKQAVGAKPIPPANTPNPPDAGGFDDIEPAARFGFGARTQYTTDWDDTVETKLRDDWKTTGSTKSFDEVKPHVRSGWDFANAKPVDKDFTH